MHFNSIAEIIAGIPFISKHQGKLLYDLIVSRGFRTCLELGFAHGVSSCYIASAIDEIGGGHLYCSDLESSENRNPNLEGLLRRAGLQNIVSIHREQHSYTWFLKKLLEERASEQAYLDFCFIDGPKNWTIDGFAFLVVERLLKPNGVIIFDDLLWTYSRSGREQTDGFVNRTMSDDQVQHPNIEAIFRLLAFPHPAFNRFKVISDSWVMLEKCAGPKRIEYIRSPVVRSFHKQIGFPNGICEVIDRR